MYRIDLPADDKGLVRRCLEALGDRFDNDTIKIDRKVFNAARISKLYGTTPHKGHSIPDRPHRPARMIEIPEILDVVPIEKLEALAAMVAKPAATPSTNNSNGQYDHRLDVPRWLSARGVAFTKKDRPSGDGRTIFKLEHCPFDASHGKNGEVSIMQAPSGRILRDMYAQFVYWPRVAGIQAADRQARPRPLRPANDPGRPTARPTRAAPRPSGLTRFHPRRHDQAAQDSLVMATPIRVWQVQRGYRPTGTWQKPVAGRCNGAVTTGQPFPDEVYDHEPGDVVLLARKTTRRIPRSRDLLPPAQTDQGAYPLAP